MNEIPTRVEAATKESYKKSLDLCRVGLLAGPSSGFALAGLLRYFDQQKDLDRFRNQEGEVVSVFVCCDTPFPYLDKYSTILDPKKTSQQLLLAREENSEMEFLSRGVTASFFVVNSILITYTFRLSLGDRLRESGAPKQLAS